MLKYDIRSNTVTDSSIDIGLVSIASYDYPLDNSKVEVRNEYSNDIPLYFGASVFVTTYINRDDGFGNLKQMKFLDEVKVVSHDVLHKNFSFIADKNIGLQLKDLSIEVEDMSLYLFFKFDAWHYFNTQDNYGITISVNYISNNGGVGDITFEQCQYVSNTELKWRYDASTQGIDDFMCSVFKNDAYQFIGYADYNEEVDPKYVTVKEIPETACFTDELYLKRVVTYSTQPLCWRYELYEKECNDGTLFGVSVTRENFRYKKLSDTEEYVLQPLISLNIPLGSSQFTNLYEEQNLNEDFIGTQIDNAVNKGIDMERFVYHPVFKTNEGYKPIHKIKFNLHFRERDKDGWIVKDDGYWNGMDKNGLHSDTGSSTGFQFFSYTGIDKGRQSDCLSYLGFNDSDVKYQKPRLSKSFLRLSFYDSKNRANQNLLGYSTIFIDSGNLFAKMMRGAKKNGIVNIGGIDYKRGLYVVSDQVGTRRYEDLKVNMEPCFEYGTDVEKVEDYRLSSQITVSDRLSMGSSEGFYLYLWADDSSFVPSDVYMRVEFNHAGYGRVVPFTMPYFSDESNGNGRIYGFEDIKNEWLNNGGWGIQKNELFSYVHFKYCYDPVSKRHVYYLDGDTYGMGSYLDNTPDELELNLYEAKINFQ